MIPHAERAAAAQATLLGLWLLQPAVAWAAAAFVVGAFGAVAAARARRAVLLAVALLGVAGAISAGVTSFRVRAVDRHWEDVREQLIRGASRQLAATLQSAVGLVRALADRGAAVAVDSQEVAFAQLERAIDPTGPEAGVVLLDPDGRPWAWAGRHRLPPEPPAGELYARITSFYVLLEARRQAQDRVAIGNVLLAADSAVPDRGRAVAARFTEATGAALEFYPPGRAPLRTDVFDYCIPSCTPGPGNLAPDTLFSVRTVPPAQGPFKLAVLATGGRAVAIIAILCFAGLITVGGVGTRYLALALAGFLLLFTPAGVRAGLETFFSPGTYYVAALDPLSASAGALFLTGAIAMAGIVALRTRPQA